MEYDADVAYARALADWEGRWHGNFAPPLPKRKDFELGCKQCPTKTRGLGRSQDRSAKYPWERGVWSVICGRIDSFKYPEPMLQAISPIPVKGDGCEWCPRYQGYTSTSIDFVQERRCLSCDLGHMRRTLRHCREHPGNFVPPAPQRNCIACKARLRRLWHLQDAAIGEAHDGAGKELSAEVVMSHVSEALLAQELYAQDIWQAAQEKWVTCADRDSRQRDAERILWDTAESDMLYDPETHELNGHAFYHSRSYLAAEDGHILYGMTTSEIREDLNGDNA